MQVGELDVVVAQSEQFLWGGREVAMGRGYCEQLRTARTWVSAINSALKTRPTLEAVEVLLARDPLPMHHPGATLQPWCPLVTCVSVCMNDVFGVINRFPVWIELAQPVQAS